MSEENKEKNEAEDKVADTGPASGTKASTPSKVSKKPGFKPVIIVVVLLVVLFGGLHLAGIIDLTEVATQAETGDTAETSDPERVIARVNNAEITQAELDERLAQVRATVPPGTPDPTTDAGFQLQMLDEIVNITLLEQLALDAGYTVSNDEVDAEIANVKNLFGGEEALNEQLTAIGLSNEQFRDNVETELLIRQLVDANTTVDEITISPEQIDTAYEEYFSGQEDAPPQEEVAGFLEEQLRQQAVYTELQAYLDTIRGAAKIEILL